MTKDDLRRVEFSTVSQADLKKSEADQLYHAQLKHQALPQKGFFHVWAIDSQTWQDQNGMHAVHRTTALIEDTNGKIHKIEPMSVTFKS